MDPATRSRLLLAARWMLLLVGVLVPTRAFAGLVEDGIRRFDDSNWTIVGLIGLILVLLALGSPRSPRTGLDEPPDAPR